MERAYDALHYADKPKAEVLSCLQCHSVATKCDSCHTRHRFDPDEARRPEACITCHLGPPHPDDETFFASAHGKLYLAEGDQWDWSKSLTKGNYPGSTCVYRHQSGGEHKTRRLHEATLSTEDPFRDTVCVGCHSPRFGSRYWQSGERMIQLGRMKLREAAAAIAARV